jgi:DNA (cytosine-5)-methyltransferase 1
MTLTYASTFTGVGGFELGFAKAGMTPTVMVEWNKSATKVLERHFPNVPKAGDICDVNGSDIGRPEVLCGGFPCQDTSIASPTHYGLSGKRSGHFYEFVRLLDEHLRLVDAARPRWCVIENVPGLLRSPGVDKATGLDRTGWDMAAVYRSLGELGYGVAHRVVDSHHFGSAQRRPRVVIVAHRGGDPLPAWRVLGDDFPGGEAAGPSAVSRRLRGPAAVVDPEGDDEVLIWRKSARARKSIAAGGYETWVPLEASQSGNTLTGFDGGGATRQTHLLQQGGKIRTLSLLEWERLSGVPDGWTDNIPTSARYEALGNIAHPAMTEWLGRRLVAVDKALPLLPERKSA